jgi:hypothetical protein
LRVYTTQLRGLSTYLRTWQMPDWGRGCLSCLINFLLLKECERETLSAFLEERFTRGAAFSLEGASDREGGRDEMISLMPGFGKS